MSVEKNQEILSNMKIHYLGLLKAGAKDFGIDFMSTSIFNNVDTDQNGEISQSEIDAALPNLDSYIKDSIKDDDFYAELYFSDSYTKALENTTENSDKTKSEQIVENNLQYAIQTIRDYASNHPEDELIQKMVKKLNELIENNKLILKDIQSAGVIGQAHVHMANGDDDIWIENHDSISNLNKSYLLQTLLHELRHSIENDSIDSQAEELEAETTSIDYTKKMTNEVLFFESTSEFIKNYSFYAKVSPGNNNIPENSGIALWYEPKDIQFDGKNLVIKSDNQSDYDNAVFEDNIQFGDEKDETGNPYPISGKRNIYNEQGELMSTIEYGEYDKNSKSFNYLEIKLQTDKIFPGRLKNFLKTIGFKG